MDEFCQCSVVYISNRNLVSLVRVVVVAVSVVVVMVMLVVVVILVNFRRSVMDVYPGCPQPPFLSRWS